MSRSLPWAWWRGWRARAETEGYGQGNVVRLPDERELLEEDFLRDHCLEPPVTVADDGALGLRFRPLAARSAGHGLRGAIWVDPDSYLITRLELQHLDGTQPVTRILVNYGDVTVDGALIRMTSSGRADFMRVSVSATFVFERVGFVEVK